MTRFLLALLLLVAISSTSQAELYDSYPPAAAASLKDHKTLIIVIGAEKW